MTAPDQEIRFGGFRLDLSDERLWSEDSEIALGSKAFALLAFLAQRANRLVTKQELLDAIWPDTYVSDAVLKVAVAEIRRALDDSAQSPRFVQTVHRRGYRFIGEVQTRRALTAEVDPPTTPHPVARTNPSLVGRDAPLAELDRRLEAARRGERSAAFITGDPGIGKTALVDAFAQHCESAGISVVRGQSRESYGEGEPYLPILEALGSLCRGDLSSTVLPILRRYAPSWLVQMPWVVDDDVRPELERAARGAQSERMLREIAEAMEAIAREAPLLVILEDLHWSDPSTLDVFSTLAQRQEPASLLVVGTYRAVDAAIADHPVRDLKRHLVGRGLCTEVSIDQLSRDDVAVFLEHQLGHAAPPELTELIHRRTEGTPLFIVSFFSNLLAQQCLEEGEQGWDLARPVSEIETLLPGELREILERQVDRVDADAQPILECASVAGRDFDASSVAGALEADVETVQSKLEELGQRRDVIRPLGVVRAADGRLSGHYEFSHVLHQHALYDRLGPMRRADLHRRVAEQLAAVDAGPARLAHHYQAAGLDEEAIAHYQRAGEQALERRANREAARDFGAALTLLETRPPSPERDQRELGLRIAIGPAIGSVIGPGSPRVAENYRIASELCRRAEVAEAGLVVIPVLFGLFIFYLARGRFRDAGEVAERLRRIAEKSGEDFLLQSAYLVSGAAELYRGHLEEASRWLDRTLELSDPGVPLVFGHPIPGLAHAYVGYVCMLRGTPQPVADHIHHAVDGGERGGDPYNLLILLQLAAGLEHLRGDGSAARELADRILVIADEQGFDPWRPVAGWFHGWARASDGEPTEGVQGMRENLDAYKATGTETARTMYIASTARACLAAGQTDEGLALVDEGLAHAEEADERFVEPELYRLRAALLLAAAPKRISAKVRKAAEEAVRRAAELAREQTATALELRAAITWHDLGKRVGEEDEPLALLRKLVAGFPKRASGPDLDEARARL